jgi:hypothetical protein
MPQEGAMPDKKKFQIAEVKIRQESSVSKYLRESANKADMKELMKGVKNLKNWVVKGDPEKEKVTAAYPDVAGHPGHVQGSDWKLQVERGRGSVDRLFLKKRKYTVEPSKKDPNIINVKIYAAAFVETDTH